MVDFIVDTLEDTVADDGMTSLREALELSAADPFTEDNIVFAQDLTGTIRLVQGSLEVVSDVQVVGDGRITINGDVDGDDVTRADGTTDILASHAQGLLDDNVRVFNAVNAHEFAVRGLAITGGFYANQEGGGGGAIAIYGSLTVRESQLIGNGAETLGTVRVEGGAIEVRPTVPSSDGTPSYFELIDSTVSYNAIFSESGKGGGFAAPDSLVIGSTISDNTIMGTTAQGGGIWAYRLEMTNSTVSNNSLIGSGEEFTSSGGGVFTRKESSFINSTISDNFVQEGVGGGIYAFSASTLSNVTVVGNTAGYVVRIDAGHDDSRALGGGVFAGDTITIVNSTITGNQTYGYANYASAGGLFAYTGAEIGNSIIAGNATNGNNLAFTDISIFFSGPGYVTQTGPNIFGGGVFAVFDQTAEVMLDSNLDGVGDTPSTIFGGVLDDNGGNVETVALDGALTNPALDAGLNALSNQGSDARGFFHDRIVDLAGVNPILDNAIDLGAYERHGLSYAEAMRVAYTYEAGLDRDGNIDLPGLNFWIDVREGVIGNGITELELAAFFLDSMEFQANVETFLGGGVDITPENVRDPGTFSDDNYVIFLYENVLDRAFDQPGFDFWSGVLDTLLASPATAPTAREALLLFFADSPENHANSPIVATLEETTLGDWNFV